MSGGFNNLTGDQSRCQFLESGNWRAILVEANPDFAHYSTEAKAQYPYRVEAFAPAAAHVCNTNLTFFKRSKVNWLRDVDYDLSAGRPQTDDARFAGGSVVTAKGSPLTATIVQSVNVVQVLAEQLLPEDTVILKVDIEGVENDMIPCLATSKSASLVDIIIMEEHAGHYPVPKEKLQALQTAKETMSSSKNFTFVGWH